jgi:hypothetical protein
MLIEPLNYCDLLAIRFKPRAVTAVLSSASFPGHPIHAGHVEVDSDNPWQLALGSLGNSIFH